jgi:5-methylcytosine-specific restriction endonuclease McrA
MDNRWKGRIVQALRRLTFSYPPRTNTKRKAKVDAATYECNLCGIYIYDGKSDKNFMELEQKYVGKVIKGRVNIDHIVPVVDSGKDFSWDLLIEGLFCPESNLQCICKECHTKKTEKENKHRVIQRKNKKS